MNTPASITIEKLASNKSIDLAFADLCQRFKDKGDNHDSWHLRFHWGKLKPQIQQQLLSGEYRFSPCRAVKINEHSIGIWCAEDTLVIKALSQLLAETITPKLLKQCTHIKGHGGLKKAVMQAKNSSSQYHYVLKSDVKSYYASMKHSLILKQFEQFVSDDIILKLLRQFLNHLDDVDGELFECTQGIGKGSSLSPLISALYLHALDQALASYAERIGGIYIRYVDDWLLLCHKRWHLRKAVKKMNQVLVALRVTKAEKKTFIGKTEKGYDWLGYHIALAPLAAMPTPATDSNEAAPVKHLPVLVNNKSTEPGKRKSCNTQRKSKSKKKSKASNADNKTEMPLVPSTIKHSRAQLTLPARLASGKPVYRLSVNNTCLNNHQTKFRRLYEQGASTDALATYVKRWWRWVHSGVELDVLIVVKHLVC